MKKWSIACGWATLVAALGLQALVATEAIAAEAQRPNIVFILTDNVGYGELGCYGGGILRGAPTTTH